MTFRAGLLLWVMVVAAYATFDVLVALPHCRQGEPLWCSVAISVSVERRHDP